MKADILLICGYRPYSAYNPRIIQKLLDIHRVHYNYVAVGEEKRTPAMRLGLAKGPVKIETILYHEPWSTTYEEIAPRRRRQVPAGSLASTRRRAPAIKERQIDEQLPDTGVPQ